ncbi:hypothetical protein FBU30_004792 [Linnemannia zychae]|nr:hypothetical protein FBU30_004792 [Linnemannia zychae]
MSSTTLADSFSPPSPMNSLSNHTAALPSPEDSDSDEIGGIRHTSNSDSSTTAKSNNTIVQNTNSTSINHGTNENKCYGRVKNPESMVSDSWWKTVFSDQLYLQTDGDVVEDPAITLEEIRVLEGIKPIHDILQSSFSSTTAIKVLDLCCGQGRHILQLAEIYPALELYGHDQSEFLIQLARSRASTASADARDDVPLANSNIIREKKGLIQFTIGDCRSIPYADNTFDLALVMGNSFGYFTTDQDNKAVLSHIQRCLKPGGVVVIDITDGAYQRENYSPRGWEWVDDEMLVCRERWLTEDKKRLVCREVIIKTTQGVIRDQFYQERLYDSADIGLLLKDTGLERLIYEQQQGKDNEGQTVHDLEVKTGMGSQRGEDLGMMGQRNFVLAIKPS